MSTLTGLSVHDNPLAFPPEAVRQAGAAAVLAFFRAVLAAKEHHQPLPGTQAPSIPSLIIILNYIFYNNLAFSRVRFYVIYSGLFRYFITK